MRQLVPLLFALPLLACSNSHVDSPDAAVTVGCTGAAPECVQGPTDQHTCGDALQLASCVDDAWQCPSGWTLGTDADCWCYGLPAGGCTCTESGWVCPGDGGMDDVCPTDWNPSETIPCSNEGQTCGECTDPCGFCNLVRCEGGAWTRLEVHPPPPGTCAAFACGPDLRCNAVTQYCFHDIGTYSCEPYPSDCTSCDCLPGDECTGDAETGITVRIYGP